MRKLRKLQVSLTTGYEVELADEEGLDHLFNAILGESITRLKDRGAMKARGWVVVQDACLLELHYVAGQLKKMNSSIGLELLLDEFGVHWDEVAKRLGS